MSDLQDDVLEQRLRNACRDVIPRLAHPGRLDGPDAHAATPADMDDNVVQLDAVRGRPRRSGAPRLVAAVAAVLLVFGGLALLQRDGQPGPSAGGGEGVGQGFTFETQTVSLRADSVKVIDGDRTSSPIDAQVSSDPGDDRYTTLEITWTEGGTEQRIFIYFAADGVNWWATEIRTYDTSRGEPDWHEPVATGTFFSAKLGAAFKGDIDLPNLRITGMTLQAFLPLTACATPTAPIALVADYPEISAAPGDFGATLRLIDTASCTPVPVADYTFEYTTDDPTIATVRDVGWPDNGNMPVEATTVPVGQSGSTTTAPAYFETRARVSLQLVASGITTVHATARDKSGNIVGTADMRVTVLGPVRDIILSSSTVPATVPDGSTTTVGSIPTGSSSNDLTPEQWWTVVEGDTLTAISERFALGAAAIAEHNGWVDGENHALPPVGSTVRIPAGGTLVASAVVPYGGVDIDPSGTKAYVGATNDLRGLCLLTATEIGGCDTVEQPAAPVVASSSSLGDTSTLVYGIADESLSIVIETGTGGLRAQAVLTPAHSGRRAFAVVVPLPANTDFAVVAITPGGERIVVPKVS